MHTSATEKNYFAVNCINIGRYIYIYIGDKCNHIIMSYQSKSCLPDLSTGSICYAKLVRYVGISHKMALDIEIIKL